MELVIEIHQERNLDGYWSITTSCASHRTVVLLADPFSDKEHDDYAWYLERYLQQEPFAESRAKAIAKSIRRYGQYLISELHLCDLIKQTVKDDSRSFGVLLSIHETPHHQIKSGIYWEILEDAELWKLSSLEVVVQRVNTNSSLSTEGVTIVRNPNEETYKTINILVLAARALNGTVNGKDEVDPLLAIKVLLAIEDWTQRNGSLYRIRVEVVRPGSLQGLAAHLQSATTSFGQGYYQIVHLDVHGLVSRDRGPKFLLSSSDSNILESTEESPKEIGDLLYSHRIKNVVVNACRSAALDHKQDLNMAQLLMSSGIENVLGMAFNVTTNAASIFLASFYDALLVKGLTFAKAAHTGRAALRTSQDRQARLGLHKSLVDYAVPLLYCRETSSNLSLLKASNTEESGSSFVLHALNQGVTKFERSLLPKKLVGRDFDLLRLERQLLSSRQLYISGRSGVGKTALLHHATEIWRRTHLVDSIVYIDFARDSWESLSAFLSALFGELHVANEELESIVNLEDTKALVESVWNMVKSKRMVLVFDGLHKIFSHYSERLHPMLVPNHRWMHHFVLILANLHHEDKVSPILFLFASRRAPESHALLPPTMDKLELGITNVYFSLGCLHLADSMELAQLSLDNVTADHTPLANSDRKELELILGILAGIPGVILSVMQFKRPSESWNSFRGNLVKGSVATLDKISNIDASIRGEFHEFCASISLEFMPTLLVLGLFWNEAPRLLLLTDFLIDRNVAADFEAALKSVIYAADWGYLEWTRTNEDVQISWLHPILTIFMRYYMVLASRNEFEFTEIAGDVPDRTARLSAQHVAMKQMKLLAFTLGMMESVQHDPDQEEVHIEGPDFQQAIILIFQTHSCQKWALLFASGWSYVDALKYWGSEPGNLDMCLRICLEQTCLPLNHWPWDYFGMQITNLRQTASPSELSYFTTRYVELLDVLCTRNGSMAFAPPLQKITIVLSTTLAAIFNCELQEPDRFKHFADLSLIIIEASEKEFGPYSEANVIYIKALAYRYSAMWYLGNNQPEQARKYFQHMLDIETDLFKDPRAMSLGWSDETIENMAKLIPGNGIDQENRLKEMASGSLWFEYYKSRRGIQNLVDFIEGLKTHGESFQKTRQFRTYLAKATQGMNKVHNKAQAVGMNDLRMDERWWPEDLHARFLQSSDSKENLRALEYAESIGDEVKARKIESLLKNDALSIADIDAVSVHIQRLQQDSITVDPMMEALTGMKNLLDTLEDDESDQPTEKIFADMPRLYDLLLSSSSNDPRQIETLKTWRELAVQNISNHNLTNKARRREATRLRNFLRAVVEVSRSSHDKTARAEVQSKQAKILKSLQDATDNMNVPNAIACLNKLEQLLKDPAANYLNTYYDSAWFYEKRAVWQVLDRLFDMMPKIQTLSEHGDWAAALDMVHAWLQDARAYQIEASDEHVSYFVQLTEIKIMDSILEDTAVKLWHGNHAALARTFKTTHQIFAKLIQFCDAARIAEYHEKYTTMMRISRILISQHG